MAQVPNITSYGGVDCLCNLDWLSLTEQGRMAISATDHLNLDWAGRRTTVTGLHHEHHTALLCLVASDLSKEQRSGAVLVAFEDMARGIFLAAVLVDGKPALGPEQIFATKAALIAHIAKVTVETGIARVLYSASLGEALNVSVPLIWLREPQLDPRDFPYFTRTRPLLSKTLKTALIAVFCGAIVFGGAARLLKPVLFPPEIAAAILPEFAFVEDGKQFRTGCEASFSEPWPTALGWELTLEGCATIAMNDPALRATLDVSSPGNALSDNALSAAAYQVFQLKANHNAILSRRAAELIYANWPHKVQVNRGKLLVFKPFDVDLHRAKDKDPKTPNARSSAISPAASPLVDRVEDAFVGVEAGIRMSHGAGASSVTVTSTASLGEVLRRLASLNDASIAALTFARGTITLKIVPQRVLMRVLPPQNTEGDTI